MPRSVKPFLMFEGVAEEAMNFYATVFQSCKILRIERYGAGEPGAAGSVKQALFSIAGQELMCFDSPVKHAFTFTPSVSLFVQFDNADELDAAFQQLSTGGAVLMPIGNYGFSQRFGWVSDRFGVSWQLNLA